MSAPSLDLVTELQEQVSRLNAKLFNYLGALQRDAPPQSLKDEPLVAPAKPYDLQAQTELMSRDLLAGLQDIQRSIQRLPELPSTSSSSEAAEVAQAVALMQQNAEASRELQQELQAAAAKLAQLQDAHGALAEAALAHRAAVAAAAAANAAGGDGAGGS